jgi:hypothetical protein
MSNDIRILTGKRYPMDDGRNSQSRNVSDELSVRKAKISTERLEDISESIRHNAYFSFHKNMMAGYRTAPISILSIEDDYSNSWRKHFANGRVYSTTSDVNIVFPAGENVNMIFDNSFTFFTQKNNLEKFSPLLRPGSIYCVQNVEENMMQEWNSYFQAESGRKTENTNGEKIPIFKEVRVVDIPMTQTKIAKMIFISV